MVQTLTRILAVALALLPVAACGGGGSGGSPQGAAARSDPATLVINEVEGDNPGTDDSEFIEILNVGPEPVPLAGLALSIIDGFNGARGVELQRIPLDDAGASIPSGGYLVWGPPSVLAALPAGVLMLAAPAATNNLGSGRNGVALIDTVALEVLDAFTYGGSVIAELPGFPAPVDLVEGSPSRLDDRGTADGFSRIPNGRDTANAVRDWTLLPTTPGMENAEPTGDPTSLVINEVDFTNPGSDTAEFVEIHNPTALSVPLTGVVLSFVEGRVDRIQVNLQLAGLALPPGGYLVFGDASVLASLPTGALYIPTPETLTDVPNGSPLGNGLALVHRSSRTLVDALSQGLPITATIVRGLNGLTSLVEGTFTPLIDEDDVVKSLARTPNARDGDNAIVDWALDLTPTPGRSNDTRPPR